MAFGTWLKNIIGKIGSAVKKAIPIAKKVIGAVAPAVHQIGGMIGGPICSCSSSDWWNDWRTHRHRYSEDCRSCW